MIQSFKEFISEAVKVADAEKVAKLITSYLKKKLGSAYLYPSIEQFKVGSDIFTTVQVIITPELLIRFNWLHGKLNTKALHSVSIFRDNSKQTVSFDKDVSLVQTLPVIVDIIKKKESSGALEVYLDDSLVESVERIQLVLNEAKVANPLAYVKSRIMKMENGDKIPTSSFGAEGGSFAYALVRLLISSNPKAIVNNRIVDKAAIKWDACEEKAANSRVKVTIKSDSTKETWVNNDIDEEEAAEQISYIEKIADLENMIKFMLKGATNSVWVGGRGGTGKTQTVEDTLHEQGLTDGDGYFKVTGSASPAAVYEALYRNRKGVILFDDCDGALDSQDGRNLIKAATDTKHIRKVAWMKKGGNYYDPDYEAEPEGDDIGDQLPRHFNFTGKIIFISNLSINKLDPDGALRTRGMMIELNPTNQDIYEYMQLIYNKIKLSHGLELSESKRREVVKALKETIDKAKPNSVNLRILVRALNLAATGLPDWQRMLRYT